MGRGSTPLPSTASKYREPGTGISPALSTHSSSKPSQAGAKGNGGHGKEVSVFLPVAGIVGLMENQSPVGHTTQEH